VSFAFSVTTGSELFVVADAVESAKRAVMNSDPIM